MNKVSSNRTNQNKFDLQHKINEWESKLTPDQRIEIRYSGLDISKAYYAFKKYDINLLTLKDISSIARISAMGIS